jgi:hypothetical protein
MHDRTAGSGRHQWMTGVDPDSLEQDHCVLDHIVRNPDARIALDCRAVLGGCVAVGDEVRFEPYAYAATGRIAAAASSWLAW